MSKTAYLALENGRVFVGKSFGKAGNVIGELVFNTSMTGYLELLTEVSYSDRIVVHTFPLIGNYGVIPSDLKNNVTPIGYIVKHWCQEPSNFRNEGDIDAFLLSNGVVGLYDIDTRALTKVIREHGSMKVMITDTQPTEATFQELRKPLPKKVSLANTITEMEKFEVPNPKYNIAVIDLGDGKIVAKNLVEYGANVTLYPPPIMPKDVIESKPDGIIFTNGSADPRDLACAVERLGEYMKCGIPMLAVGMSHLTIALCSGATVERMKHGHNGGQAVRDVFTGRTYITRQSHQCVVTNIDDVDAELFLENINDGTCEGLIYRNAPIVTAQFTPDFVSGEHGTGFVFDKFIDLINKSK